MITLTSSTPASGSTGIYTDASVSLVFSKQIEASYATSSYFKVYKTNEDQSEFQSATSMSVTVDTTTVTLDPSGVFDDLSYYVVIVTGGTTGVRSIDNDYLSGNIVVSFKTGDTVSPLTNETDEDTTPNPGVPASGGTVVFTPSVDFFSESGTSAPIVAVRSVPADLSVGVTGITKIIVSYNDEVDVEPLASSLKGKYAALPFDPNPFADHSITPTGVTVNGNDLEFTIPALGDMTNKEYVFIMAPNIIHGKTRAAKDTKEMVIRFTGPLTPLFVSPDQIKRYLNRFEGVDNSRIPDYELYKLIYEKSLEAQQAGVVMDASNSMQIGQYIVCLVLRDLFGLGFFLAPNVKSRSLLQTSVSYYDMDLGSVLSNIDDCIRENNPISSGVIAGIKSGNIMNRPTKRSGTYR
jgi:hypothetical protein